MATESRETGGLIGSDKVEGTAVYDARGEKIGSIERVMIDKRSGQVAYAVLSFGGFLGIGSDYYPIPWASLKYSSSQIDSIKVYGVPSTQHNSSRVGGVYAKLRGSHPACRESPIDDWLNRSGIHGAAAPFRAGVGDVYAGPHR
jgi:hypothetical protein